MIENKVNYLNEIVEKAIECTFPLYGMAYSEQGNELQISWKNDKGEHKDVAILYDPEFYISINKPNMASLSKLELKIDLILYAFGAYKNPINN